MAARARGDEAGWRQALEAVLAEAEDPRALNALGNHQLNAGDIAGGRALLERAVKADPQAPPLWLNLALARRNDRDVEGELAALDQALALDPYFLQAIIHRAFALERLGANFQAGRAFKDAIACATAQPDIAARVQPLLLEQARAGVERHAKQIDAALAERFDAVRERYGHGDAKRIEEMLDIFNGRAVYQVQRPTFLAFPGLPPLDFYPREDFLWLDALEAASDSILAELVALRESNAPLEPYIAHPPGRPVAQWEELNHSPRWSVFHLFQHGKRVDANVAHTPQTLAALEAAPLADVPGNAPNAFFSVLQPRTRIPPHTGMTNTRLVVHLPLIVPQGCSFRVGNRTRQWEVGKAWVFDDTMDHEARNDSDAVRIILICDCWNPYLTAMERDLVRAFFEGYNALHGAGALSAGL